MNEVLPGANGHESARRAGRCPGSSRDRGCRGGSCENRVARASAPALRASRSAACPASCSAAALRRSRAAGRRPRSSPLWRRPASACAAQRGSLVEAAPVRQDPAQPTGGREQRHPVLALADGPRLDPCVPGVRLVLAEAGLLGDDTIAATADRGLRRRRRSAKALDEFGVVAHRPAGLRSAERREAQRSVTLHRHLPRPLRGVH